MLGHWTRTELPTAETLLETPTSPTASSSQVAEKRRPAAYFYHGAKGNSIHVKFDDGIMVALSNSITQDIVVSFSY